MLATLEVREIACKQDSRASFERPPHVGFSVLKDHVSKTRLYRHRLCLVSIFSQFWSILSCIGEGISSGEPLHLLQVVSNPSSTDNY